MLTNYHCPIFNILTSAGGFVLQMSATLQLSCKTDIQLRWCQYIDYPVHVGIIIKNLQVSLNICHRNVPCW